jgi:hypothetical protein
MLPMMFPNLTLASYPQAETINVPFLISFFFPLETKEMRFGWTATALADFFNNAGMER